MTEVACSKYTMSLWRGGCDCADCVTAYWRVKKAYSTGNYKRATPEQAMVVLDALIERRWSSLAVATATGINPATAANIFARRRKGMFLRLGPLTCKALIEHGRPTDGSVGTTGARRRLQALAYLGYTLDHQATALGIHFTTLHAICTGRTRQVKATTDNAIRDLYRRWQMTPGPSLVAARTALANGYHPAMAWDDETIDDPNAKPAGVPTQVTQGDPAGIDEAAIQRRIDGDREVRLHAGEAAELTRRLLAAGWSKKRIYVLTGVEPNRYKNEVA